MSQLLKNAWRTKQRTLIENIQLFREHINNCAEACMREKHALFKCPHCEWTSRVYNIIWFNREEYCPACLKKLPIDLTVL